MKPAGSPKVADHLIIFCWHREARPICPAAKREPRFPRPSLIVAEAFLCCQCIYEPILLLELGLAAALAWSPGGTAAWCGLGLLGIIWLSTALCQMPMHRRLERGFDQDAHRRLVVGNWVRTIGWSLRGVLAILMLVSA